MSEAKNAGGSLDAELTKTNEGAGAEEQGDEQNEQNMVKSEADEGAVADHIK